MTNRDRKHNDIVARCLSGDADPILNPREVRVGHKLAYHRFIEATDFTDQYRKCPHGVEFYKPCHDCDPELYDFMMGY